MKSAIYHKRLSPSSPKSSLQFAQLSPQPFNLHLINHIINLDTSIIDVALSVQTTLSTHLTRHYLELETLLAISAVLSVCFMTYFYLFTLSFLFPVFADFISWDYLKHELMLVNFYLIIFVAKYSMPKNAAKYIVNIGKQEIRKKQQLIYSGASGNWRSFNLDSWKYVEELFWFYDVVKLAKNMFFFVSEKFFLYLQYYGNCLEEFLAELCKAYVRNEVLMFMVMTCARW